MATYLVDQELKLHILIDANAFSAYSLELERHLAANLRQLLGFDDVGNDRKTRRVAAGWYNIRDVKSLSSGSST